MNNPRKIVIAEKTCLMLMAILPLLYMHKFHHIPLAVFLMGTGSWGIGCILKLLAHQTIIKTLHKQDYPIITISLLNGLLSGLFELGAAYFIIQLTKDKFVYDYHAIIAFGLAIGSMEIFMLTPTKGNDIFKGTTLEKSSGNLVEFLAQVKGVYYYFYNLVLPIIERAIATLLHVATRGLVFLTIIRGNWLPMSLALLTFIIADGILGYYFIITDRLSSGKGYVQLHLYLFILAVLILFCFLVMMHPFRGLYL